MSSFAPAVGIARGRTKAYSNEDGCQVLRRWIWGRKNGARRPRLGCREAKQVLVSVLAGGLLHGNVAGGAKLGADVDCSKVVQVHVPGAVGGAEDREGAIDSGVVIVDPAHGDVSVRSKLGGLADHAVTVAAHIPVAGGGAKHGEVSRSVGISGTDRRPVVSRHRDVAGCAELRLDIHCAKSGGDVSVQVHITEAIGRPPDRNIGPEVPVVVRRHRNVAIGPELDGGGLPKG